MKIFYSITDVIEYISSLLESVHIECYRYEYEDLVEGVARSFINLMKKKGYRYGEDFDESLYSDEEFWAIVEEFEF